MTPKRTETEKPWQALARAIRQWREDVLQLPQSSAAERAGFSLATWRQLEHGSQESYRPVTLRAVERTLGWPSGTVAAILEGGEPPDPDELRKTGSGANGPIRGEPVPAPSSVDEQLRTLTAQVSAQNQTIAELTMLVARLMGSRQES